MDREPEPKREVTRIPTDADLVSLARELNRLGVASVVVGGFAINRLGFVRATEDIDLLVARDRANQALVKKAMEILPDRAILELGDEDIAQWVVVQENFGIPDVNSDRGAGRRISRRAGTPRHSSGRRSRDTNAPTVPDSKLASSRDGTDSIRASNGARAAMPRSIPFRGAAAARRAATTFPSSGSRG
jgi:hypothetical protein